MLGRSFHPVSVRANASSMSTHTGQRVDLTPIKINPILFKFARSSLLIRIKLEYKKRKINTSIEVMSI